MITFSQTGGTSGITTISVSATSTQNTADTVSNYTLSNENGFEMPMPVVQRAFIPVAKYITITPSVLSSPFSGGYKTITINSNDDWSIDSDGWITISITGGTSGSTIVPVMIEENTGTSRNGIIKCACLSDHSISANTIVNQEGSFKPYINLGYYVLSATSESATTSVTVSSNISWNVITDSRWVTVNTLSGSNNGSVSFTIAENTSAINREGSITVFNTEYDIYVDLVIRQSASEQKPYIKLSPNSFSVPYEGSTGNTISVSANCGYDIEADVPWITVNAVSGSGNGSVSFSTSSMTGSSVGNIVFSNSAVTEYATVETVLIPYLSASTNYISSSSTGGTFEVSVYSNVNWSVSVDIGEDTPSTPWLSAMPSSGSNNGSITISVLSGEDAMSGSVVLSNYSYGLEYVIGVEKEEYVDGTKLYYTTTGNTTITGYVHSGWGATIISNTYKNGQGVITFDDNIISVPSNAFSGNTKLETIKLPNTITSIGSNSFRDCNNLIGDLKIPSSATTIGSYAFKNCEKLSGYLTIPDTVTDIGGYAFEGCRSITGLTIGRGLTSIESGTFNYNGIQGQLVIPNNITYFSNCFLYCTGITSVVFSNSVTTDGGYTFRGCRSITEIVLPSNITTVGQYCYDGCSGLTSVTLTNIDVIAGYAFNKTTNLKEIYSYRTTQPSMILNNAFYKAGENVSQKTFHYPSGSDYSNFISALPSGWTAVADL